MGEGTHSPTAMEAPAGSERIFVGKVIDLGGRHVRVCGMPDGVTVCRDYRGRVAVRNFASNRLSYIPEWRLLKA